ncbi:fumarylacetoacetate hydrolase family protein [Nocardiopsis coralliicola]
MGASDTAAGSAAQEGRAAAGLVRYAVDGQPAQVGVRDAEGGVRPVAGARRMADLLALDLAELQARVIEAQQRPAEHARSRVRLLPPVDGLTEVWASGVTYERSRAARGEESDRGDLYDRVYTAERPELFFKSPAWRTVTDGEPVAVRADSGLDTPEPELAAVLTAAGAVAGYTVCDDVSSRSIEGENALYLPQAKVYAGACALAPVIRPAWELPGWASGTFGGASVRMHVDRAGTPVFAGEVGLASLRRSPDDLAGRLYAGLPFPEGAVLATGTGVVPPLTFTLTPGDTVTISISSVGALRTPVVRGPESLAWLAHSQCAPDGRPPLADPICS